MTYFFIMTSLTFHGLKIVFGTDCFRVLSSRHFFRFNLMIQIKMQHCEDQTLTFPLSQTTLTFSQRRQEDSVFILIVRRLFL